MIWILFSIISRDSSTYTRRKRWSSEKVHAPVKFNRAGESERRVTRANLTASLTLVALRYSDDVIVKFRNWNQ